MDVTPFLDYLATERRFSPHTCEAYRRDLGQLATYLSGTYEVTDPAAISRQMVRSWVASLIEAGNRERTIHRKLSAANAWFRFLQKTSGLPQNPARGVPRPKLPGRLPVFLEERSASRLYDPGAGEEENTFGSARDRLMLQLLYETGMRVSELTGLKAADLDRGLGVVRVTGKRNKTRLIPVSAAMFDSLGRYQAMKETEFPGLQEDAFFVTDTGRKASRQFVYQRVNRYLSAITTQRKKSPHTLRHSFATHMLNNGAELNVIKEILGHSSLAATQVYTHLSVEKLRGIHRQAHPRHGRVNP